MPSELLTLLIVVPVWETLELVFQLHGRTGHAGGNQYREKTRQWLDQSIVWRSPLNHARKLQDN